MKRTQLILLFLVCLLSVSSCAADQSTRRAGRLVVIIPFENISKAPGIDWIGEAFSEVLGRRMAASQLFVIRREDRLYAFDRLGIPSNLRPSRATLYRIGEEMDVDYVVIGSYTFDGRTFTARSQLMDLKRLRILPEVVESGALTQLEDIQSAVVWDLLNGMDPMFMTPKNSFVAAPGQVRLDALENYIRGVLDTAKPDKIKHFKEAIRLNPAYSQAMLQLGKAYFESKEYEPAALWFSKVPKTEGIASEANFYLGLASYYTGNFERAEEAFAFVATRVPLIEVYNNLGVVTARRGKKSSVEYFQRAAEADSRDEDYRFNLGLALYRTGNATGAVRQLKEAIGLKPQDTEAKSLLDLVSGATTAGAKSASAEPKLPLERIKRNYDETSYRQLALEIQNINEQRYAELPRPEHAAVHVKHGGELANEGLLDPAESEFREAILLDLSNPEAHLGLATVLEQRNELAEARSEAVAANRLKFSAEGFLVLARVDLKQNKIDSARDNVDRALKLEPNSTAAVNLKRTIADQMMQKPKEGSQQ